MKNVNIFWTGGLDSTCRVLELSIMHDVEIQPYYIIIPTRKSSQSEINAINNITNIIRKLPNYNGHLNDLKIYKIYEFENYPDIHKGRCNQKEYKVGYQYSYCADLCRYLNMQCEICLENEPTCSGHRSIKHEVVLCENELDYFIDKQKSPKNNIYNIFENILFPKSIFNMSKKDEIEYITCINVKILDHIIFCHKLTNGELCGECTPCKSYKKLGLFNLFNAGKAMHLESKQFNNL